MTHELFNFGSLTGVSGSASAERKFQPQKGITPVRVRLHILLFLPGYRIFPWIPRLLVSFGGMSLPYGKSTFGGNGASDIDAT
jgi:hypothetical protein